MLPYDNFIPTNRRSDIVMNKLLKNCLLGITATMTLGLATVALTTKKDISKADAITGSMHYYVNVTDEADLHVGDVILLFTSSGRTFECAAGNPRFYQMNYVSGVNNDITRAYVDESQVKRFELGAGVKDENSTVVNGVRKDSFSLKLLDHPGFADVRGKYLYFTEDRYSIQPHDKNDVGYYMTNMCFKSYSNGNVDGHASWEFFYKSSLNEFHITRQDEPRKEENHGLCYGGSSARPALNYAVCEGGFRVFKEISLSADKLKEYNPVVTTNSPNRDQYYVGDTADLSGLQISIIFRDESTITASYDNEPSFFKTTSQVQNTGNVVVEYCGLTFTVGMKIIEKTVDQNDFCLVSGTLEDYRGTYIACANIPEDNVYGLTSNLIKTNSTTSSYKEVISDYSNGIAKIGTSNPIPFRIERLTVGGQSRYFISIFNGYLSYELDMWDGGCLIAKSKESLTANDAITIDSSSHVFMNGRVLTFSTAFSFEESSSNEVRLYKLMPGTDYNTHITNYVTTFINSTADACSAENVTSSIWESLATAFESLTVDEQGYFASLAYTHNFEDINTEENVVDRYDYIVAKYKYADFMNRKDAGTWRDYYTVEDSSLPVELSKLLGLQVENSVLYIAISITSLVSLTLVLFFVAKRKHQ